MVLPKLAFGPQIQVLPQRQQQLARACVKKSMKMSYRAHAWEMIVACVHPIHRTDPNMYLIHTHLSSLLKAMRECREVRQLWIDMHTQHRQPKTNGMVHTAMRFLDQLGIQRDMEGLIWDMGEGEVQICHDEMGKIMHMIREKMRETMLSQAEQKRHRLMGCANAHTETMRNMMKKKQLPFRAEIIMLIADGVWTQSRKAKAALVENDRCHFCGQPETVEHILYECPRWRKERDAFRDWIPLLRAGTSSRALCGIPDHGLTQKQLKQWPELLLKMGRLLNTRLQNNPVPRKTQCLPRENERTLCPDLPRPSRNKLDFRLQDNIRHGPNPWKLTRRAWRMLNVWASQLCYQEEGGFRSCRPFWRLM